MQSETVQTTPAAYTYPLLIEQLLHTPLAWRIRAWVSGFFSTEPRPRICC